MLIDTCIIVKNEEKTIGNLINQLLIFSNEIHITDTGSTDNTINIIKESQKNNSNIFLHHFEWCMDFAKARNYSFNCYESKADYIFWCDGDDELNEQLINTLKEFAKSENNNDSIYDIKYKYTSNYTNTLYRTSLIKRSENFTWQDPVHEYISINVNSTINYTLFDNGSLIIHKRTDFQENTDRNFEIFMNMEKNNYHFTPRIKFLYGREFLMHKMIKSSIHYFHECINDESPDNLSKINSCIYLFKSQDKEAPDYFFKLFKNNIYRKDLFYYAGNYYFNDNNLKLAKFYYILCNSCEEPSNNMIFEYDNNCHINSFNQINIINRKNIINKT